MIIKKSNIAPFIQLETHNVQEETNINNALSRIKNTPAGRALLDEIKKVSINTKQIRIISIPFESNQIYPELSDKQIERLNENEVLDPHRIASKARNYALKKGIIKGNGSSARIIFNRTRVDTTVFGFRSEEFIAELNDNNVGLPNNDPTLFNNLVHGMRILKGTYTDDNSLEGREDEEVRAIGNGPYQGFPISENQFRQQIGFPLRAYYPEVTNVNFTPSTRRPGVILP